MAYDEPTCVLKMLNDFRAGNRLSSTFDDPKLSKNKLRKFTDTSVESSSEISSKKLKREINDKISSINRHETVTSPEIRRIAEELIEVKTQNISLQEKLNRIKLLKEEETLNYENEKKTLQQNLHNERCKVNELEVALKNVHRKEREVYDQLVDCKYSGEEKNHDLYSKVKQLEQENLALKTELKEVKIVIRQKDYRDQFQIDSVNSELSLLKNKLQTSEKLIADLSADLREKTHSLSKLEVERTKLLLTANRAQDLEYEKETFLETRAYVEAQSKKLFRYNEMEKLINTLKEENKKLKSTVSNTLYLENIVDDLRSRQSITDNLQQQVIKLQTENQNLSLVLDQFNELIKHYCDVSDVLDRPPVISLRRRLDELVKKELLFVSEKSQLELSKQHLEDKCVELKNKLDQYEASVNKLKESGETNESTVRRLKKQLYLTIWERNDLRALLDSWQKETTVGSTENNQFEILQRTIDGYVQRMEQITNDSTLINNTNFGVDEKITTLTIEHEKAVKKITNLENINEQLALQVEQLNEQLQQCGKRDFDSSNTKIVHLKLNPTSEAVENYEDRLNKAKEEVNRLRERIKILEEGHTQDVTRLVEERIQTDFSKEVEELKDRVKSQEIQNQRLCEVFKKRSQNFRDAVYILFGYKLDSLANDRYRILSVYAEDPQDILQFQMSQSESGTMEMLETSYSKTLEDLIDLHLNRHRSIPLFLASLTTTLFNKQTLVSST